MFKISSNGIITVNRGDSFELPIALNIGSSLDNVRYELTDKDTVYIGIMEPHQKIEDPIIRKVYKGTSYQDDIAVRFWPEDTINLYPGKYYYQVKLETVDEDTGKKDVETVIDKTLFYIKE